MATTKKTSTEIPGALKEETRRSLPESIYIDDTWNFEDVLKLDMEGKELFFLHEKGKFLELDEAQIREFSAKNKQSYIVSKNLNLVHSPETDEIHHHIQISQQLRARNLTEREMKQLPQSAQAARKLTAWVGEGFQQHWFRPDEIQTAIERGYEYVSPDMVEKGEAITTISATNGHYECKRPDGATDLVLMRIPKEGWARLEAEKQEKRDMQARAAENTGKSALRRLGGNPDEAMSRAGNDLTRVSIDN